jgi:hypothetical protein
MNAATLIHDLRSRGFSLAAVKGSLQVRPAANLTPADRAAIRAQLAELLAEVTPGCTFPLMRLSGRVAWDQGEALRLLFEADELVERLGVSGRHPEIAAAAAVVDSALATRDLETVRFAVAEFAAAVRSVFTEQGRSMMCVSNGSR